VDKFIPDLGGYSCVLVGVVNQGEVDTICICLLSWQEFQGARVSFTLYIVSVEYTMLHYYTSTVNIDIAIYPVLLATGVHSAARGHQENSTGDDKLLLMFVFNPVAQQGKYIQRTANN